MKTLLSLLSLSVVALAQNALAPNFSTAPNNGGLRWESRETLTTSAKRLCSASTVAVTRTSASVLSMGNGASSSAIQFVRFNPLTRPITAAVALTISSGSAAGSVDIYGQIKDDGTFQFAVYNRSANVLSSASGGVVSTAPGSTPKAAILLYTWTMTAGAWDTSGGTDKAGSATCWLDQITLTNNTSSAVTVTITDNQTTPLYFLNAVSLAANSTTLIELPGGEYFESGALAQAGTANAIGLEVRGVRNVQAAAIP